MKRVKGELVGAIYEKALKRKDITGAVTRSKLEKASEKQEMQGKDGNVNRTTTKAKKATAEADLASADIGKIVSLIASDASRVAATFTYMPVSPLLDVVFGIRNRYLDILPLCFDPVVESLRDAYRNCPFVHHVVQADGLQRIRRIYHPFTRVAYQSPLD